jgi:hypothetical protein
MYSQKWNARPRSQFLYSCICEQFIYFHDWSAYFAKSQVHECKNWERGRAFSFLGIFYKNFRYSVFAVYTVLRHCMVVQCTVIIRNSYLCFQIPWCFQLNAIVVSCWIYLRFSKYLHRFLLNTILHAVNLCKYVHLRTVHPCSYI